MGWEHIFAGLVAAVIVENHEKKKEKRIAQASRKYSTQEQVFLARRSKHVLAKYTAVQPSWLTTPSDAHNLFAAGVMEQSEVIQLTYFYSRLEINPASLDARTSLIHYLLHLWKEEEKDWCIDLLQNELTYMIDCFSPAGKLQEMYQHLAMFLSSECFLFRGDYTNALKRLYQTIEWKQIYDNIEEIDGIDLNGLSDFHEAVLVNIINIYALAGLPEKTDEVRRACATAIQDYHSSLLELRRDAITSSEDYQQYLQYRADALMAKYSFCGYYLISESSYKNNLFKESTYGEVRGQSLYSIETSFVEKKYILEEDVEGYCGGVYGAYPSLRLSYHGHLLNYKQIAESLRTAICQV